MKKYSSLLVILSTLLLSCQERDEANIAKMIEERVERRLTEYVQIENDRCRIQLLEEASAVADSILRANPIRISLDSLQRPPVPPKPTKPQFERPKDSIKIAPIIAPKLEKH